MSEWPSTAHENAARLHGFDRCVQHVDTYTAIAPDGRAIDSADRFKVAVLKHESFGDELYDGVWLPWDDSAEQWYETLRRRKITTDLLGAASNASSGGIQATLNSPAVLPAQPVAQANGVVNRALRSLLGKLDGR